MAKCRLCGDRSTLFHRVRLNSKGYCEECADELRWRREQRKKREAEEAAKLEELRKPYVPADVTRGFCLAHTYSAVNFYSPDDCKKAAAAVPPREQLTMKYEPDNPYDRDAIAIYHKDVKIGYMYKGKLRDMLNDYAKADNLDFLAVSRFWVDKPMYDLFFYQKLPTFKRRMRKRPDFKECTLTGNKNEDMQESIDCCEAGEMVTVWPDFDKDRFEATCHGLDIGYFPKSLNDYLEEHTELDARISSISEDDHGKYTVSVMMAPKNLTPEE